MINLRSPDRGLARFLGPLAGRRRAALTRGVVLAVAVTLTATAFLPGRALAARNSAQTVAAPKPVSAVVSAKQWKNTGINVKSGQELRITATGTWTDGTATSGPNGSATLWPDNFFNLADLGVCNVCAPTKTGLWGALIGYIGDSPPGMGSYTSTAVRPKAINVFYVGGSYEAQVLTTGRLWLAKNADAYSNNTVDNSGQVTAKVTVLPQLTASQVAALATTAAKAVKSATPLQQAELSCAYAFRDHAKDWAKNTLIKHALDGVGLNGRVYEGLVIANNGLSTLYYDAGNGDIAQVEFDTAKLVFEILGSFGGAYTLFGLIGPPAVDCVQAGFWLEGQLAGQLANIIKQKIWPPTTANAGITGTWTFDRAVLSCVNFPAGCASTPIVLDFSNCSAATCTMTWVGGPWQQSHTITRNGSVWTASFTDVQVSCGSDLQIPAGVTIRLIVTSSTTQNGTRIAKTIGGTLTNSLATWPQGCLDSGAASTLEDLTGTRS